MTALDVLRVSRVSLDLYPQQLRVPGAHFQTFRKSIRGMATKVAVAGTSRGHRTAVVTKVGEEMFGVYVRDALHETFGLDTPYVGVGPELRTLLVIAELMRPDEEYGFRCCHQDGSSRFSRTISRSSPDPSGVAHPA